MAFIGSPEVVVAKTLAGSLSFNPVTDSLMGSNGPVLLDPKDVGAHTPSAAANAC